MRTIGRFAPPLALMALIFVLSDQPDLSSGLGVVDLVGRKLVHMAEYGLLWWLWLRALRFRHPYWAAAIALGYAATDELHQTFVHGRSGTPVDVGIDALGIALAALGWWWWRRSRRGSDPAALGRQQDGLGAVERAELAVDVVQVGPDRAGRE